MSGAVADVATDEDVSELRVGRRLLRVSDRPGTDPDAPPLLLLMGLGGNIEMWEPLRTKLAAAGGMRTVAFDIPGTGGSPASRFPRSLPLLGRLTVRLLDRLGIDQADVLGLSWGGMLAQQLALTSRRRVRRLVLANTNFGMGSVPGAPAALRHLLSLERYRSDEGLARAALSFGGSDLVLLPHERDAHAAARLAHPPSTRGYYYQLLAPLWWSSLPALPLLFQPTLVLAGDRDAAIPAVNARMLSALIPRARLHVFPGAGHLVLFQRPDEAAQLVAGFLAAP